MTAFAPCIADHFARCPQQARLLLSEAVMPFTAWGYWVTENGDLVPVAEQKHAEVAAKLLGREYDPQDEDSLLLGMYRKGAARVIWTGSTFGVVAQRITLAVESALTDLFDKAMAKGKSVYVDRMPGYDSLLSHDPDNKREIGDPEKKWDAAMNKLRR